MYDLFDTFFNPWYDDSEYNKKAPKQQASQNTQNLMKTDIRELADGYELQMELPGYKKEEVQAALHKGYLTISAAKSAEETVGEYLRPEDIRASFHNGILPDGDTRPHRMISVRKISGQVSRTVFLPCLFQRKIRQRQKKRNILPLRNPL